MVTLQVDQDCFVKGEEDMVDSVFQPSPSPLLPNGDLLYSGADASADTLAQGMGLPVGRAASAHGAPAGGAAESTGTFIAPA